MRDFITFRSSEDTIMEKKLKENYMRRQKQTKEIEKGARLYVLNKQKENYINFQYLVDLLTLPKNIKLLPEEFLSEYNRILEKISESVLLEGFDFLEDDELKKDVNHTKDQLQKIKILSNVKEKSRTKSELLNKYGKILNSIKIFLESYWIQVYKRLYPSMTHEEVVSIAVETWEVLQS